MLKKRRVAKLFSGMLEYESTSLELRDHDSAKAKRLDGEVVSVCGGVISACFVQEVSLTISPWIADFTKKQIAFAHHDPTDRASYEPRIQQQRQTVISEELLEVTAGFEVLMGSKQKEG